MFVSHILRTTVRQLLVQWSLPMWTTHEVLQARDSDSQHTTDAGGHGNIHGHTPERGEREGGPHPKPQTPKTQKANFLVVYVLRLASFYDF